MSLKILLFAFCWYFFHGKMNLVGFRVEAMALSETFAWFINFRFFPENFSIKLWVCGHFFVWFVFFKYSVLVFAWKMKSRCLAFSESSQKHELFLHKKRQLPYPTFRRKTLRSNTHISHGSDQHILSTPTNLML